MSPNRPSVSPVHAILVPVLGRMAAAGVAALFAVSAWAQPVALRHVRLIDGSGSAPLVDATVVVDGGRIVALGAEAGVAIPEGAQQIDLTGRSVLPGLISDHSHVGLVDGTTVGPQHYTRANVERQLQQWQRHGVTTVTSLGMNAPLFNALRDEAHAGTLKGADLFGADRGFGVRNGAPPVKVGADQLYTPDTPEQARQMVRDSATRKPDVLKIWVDDFAHTLPFKMKPEIYRAIIDEAHRLGLRTAAHVYYLDDARDLVESGVDIIAHGIRDRPVDDALIRAMQARGTWYIPTLGLDETFYVWAQRPQWTREPFALAGLQPALLAQFDDGAWREKTLSDSAALARNQASLAMNQRNLKRLYDSGVNIGFGTDSGANALRVPGVAEHRELQLMVDAGLSPMQALQIATRNAAALLGLKDRGRLAVGGRADLLVVDGDPTTDIAALQRIDAVWQRGERVAGPVAK